MSEPRIFSEIFPEDFDAPRRSWQFDLRALFAGLTVAALLSTAALILAEPLQELLKLLNSLPRGSGC